VAPIALIILLRIPVYDNFRQLFFTIPPIVILSGIGLSLFLRKIKHRFFNVAIVLIVLAPGLVNIVTLHPYEYIYYNSFFGGVNRAYKNYELDYWCTSLKESILFINKIAPPNSSLVIAGPVSAATPYAREDLKISNTDNIGEDLDFAIACRYSIWDDDFYPDFEEIFNVRRGSGVLSIVRARK
jgi:hypothetical protein